MLFAKRTRAVLLTVALTGWGCGKGADDQGARDGGTPAADGGSPYPAPPPASFTFESGPVRPVAIASDGARLFVANTPDGYLEIWNRTETGLTHHASVAVGVEPVAVAVRNDHEVWVVNHVSDSVSVVDTASTPPRVVRTLLVGDEPRDIVFAGPSRARAFITTAHRGQQRTAPALAGVPGAGDPQLTTASVGRADVWVFDATDLGTTLGGKPVAIVTLAGDTPRALAVSADGARVYAAVFKSGNRTTATSALLACDGWDSDTPCTIAGNVIPGSPRGPATNHAGVPAPRVGTIVKADAEGAWRDARGRDWSDIVKFSLPDDDVFAIDATTLQRTTSFRHVGTTLFNMAVNPVSGAVYVSNTEARNDLRFEGNGTFAKETLQGHLAESRITVIRPDATVAPRHLNKHIPYDVLPAPAGVKQHSLAAPLDLVVSADGKTLYVAAFGSNKIGVFSTAALDDDSFDPTATSADALTVTGGGPSGLVLDEAHQRLYVTTRFDDGVSVIDLVSKQEIAHVTMHTPEPTKVRAGRSILYDATLSSQNGEAACASCHMFGDTDQLAWDLGDPDGDVIQTPIPIKLSLGSIGNLINGTGDITKLHPMKGPMGTQTLRGMVNHGAMHWRGDRVDGFYGVDTRALPPYDSELAFKNFIVAFNGLLGRSELMADGDMQAFADFALAIAMPPNPIRALDNQLDAQQARGQRYFMGCEGLDSKTGKPVECVEGRPVGLGHLSDGRVNAISTGFTCEGCHTLRPDEGFFGGDGQSSFEALPQTVKIPQLRNLYDRVGMFGAAHATVENAGDNDPKGAQVRGFGFANDGTVDTLFRFLNGLVFNGTSDGRIGFVGGDDERRAVEAYLLAFDTDLAPIVGQQITLSATDAATVGPRIDLLRARALTPFASKLVGNGARECDLVVRGVVDDKAVAYQLRLDGLYAPDDDGAAISDSALRAIASVAGQALTFTCLPPGWGPLALDRDQDGVKNRLDRCPEDSACQ